MGRNSGMSEEAGRSSVKFSIEMKMILMGLVIAVFFMIFLLGYILPKMKQALLDESKEKTREAVQIAWTVLNHYHQLEVDRVLTREEAQKEAISAVRDLRYGLHLKDYFWINDFKPYMIMHPFRKDLEGKSLSDYLDPTGKAVFIDFVKVCKQQKEGFSSYEWQYGDEEKRIESKLSYVKLFEPWDWIVGTGIYTVDIDEIITGQRNGILFFGGIFALIAALLVYALTRSVARPLRSFTGIAERIAAGDLTERINIKYRSDEIGVLAAAMNRIIDTVKALIIDVGVLSKAGIEGKLTTRADAGRHLGDFHKIVDGMNKVMDSMVSHLDVVPAPVLIMDREMGILYANNAAAAAIGLPKNQIVGTKCHTHMKTSDCNTGKCACMQAMQTGRSATSLTNAHPGGSNLEIEYTGIPLRNEEGDVIGVFEIAIDLTTVNKIMNDLRETAKVVAEASEKMMQSITENSAALDEQVAISTQQAASVTEVTATMEEFSGAIGQVASHGSQVSESAKKIQELTSQGAEAVESVNTKMRDVNQENQRNIARIIDLGKKSEEITKVMTIINNIADQTKLIAFNAALEASSAGEYGRRFGVVASEIRRLANSVMESTGEIDSKISEIKQSVNNLVVASEKSSKGIDECLQHSIQASEQFEGIVKNVESNADVARQIAVTTHQQKIAGEQVVKSVKEISIGANQISVAMRQVSNSGKELAAMAQKLQAQVNKFNLTG